MQWQACSNVIVQLLSFVVGVVLARVLTPIEFGLFAMAEILFNFIFIFWNLGVSTALVQRKTITDIHLNVCFTLCLILGAASYVLSYFTLPFVAAFFEEPLLAPIGRVTCLVFIIYAFDRVPTALLDRDLRFKERSIASLLNPLVYGCVSISMALSGFGAFSFAWAVVARAVVATLSKIIIGSWFYSWRPKFSFSKTESKELISYGCSVTAANFSSWVFDSLPRLVTGKYLGSSSVGYLYRSMNLSTILLRQVNTSVSSVILPGFSRVQDDFEKIRGLFKKLLFLTYSLLTPSLIFFVFFPEQAIIGIFGLHWQEAVPLLPWLAGATFFAAPLVYFDSVLKAIGKPNVMLAINILSIILLGVLLLIFAKKGVLFVAIVLVWSTFFRFCLNIIFFHFMKIFTFLDMWKSIAEPVVVNFTIGVVSLFIYILFFDKYTIVIELMICFFLYMVMFCFYLYIRYRHPYVSYIDINIREGFKK